MRWLNKWRTLSTLKHHFAQFSDLHSFTPAAANLSDIVWCMSGGIWWCLDYVWWCLEHVWGCLEHVWWWLGVSDTCLVVSLGVNVYWLVCPELIDVYGQISHPMHVTDALMRLMR